MKLIETPGIYSNKDKEYTVKEAISNALYGVGYEDAKYQIDRVIGTLSSLIQMLEERGILKSSEIEELASWDYIIKKEDLYDSLNECETIDDDADLDNLIYKAINAL